MKRPLFIGLFLLISFAAAGNANAKAVILVRARIESFADIREIPSRNGELYIGALYSVHLGSVEPLIGDAPPSSVDVDLTMTSMPEPGGALTDLYVLLARLPDGRFQALDWDYYSSGLCVGRDVAKVNVIEDDLVRLRRSGKVNWNPDCGW